MKKRRRIISVCMTVLVMLLAVAGCGKKEDITGKWVYTEESTGQTASMEFFSDGTGKITEEDSLSYSCEWTTEDGRLKVEVDTGILGKISRVVDYKLDGDTLTLTDDDGESAIYYRE